MKNLQKLVGSTLAFAAVLFIMSSCNKTTCYECSGENLPTVEICDDTATDAEINATKTAYRAANGDCVEK